MCGIAGILNLDPHAPPVSTELLVAMRDKLVHRGPDASGVWRNAEFTVGLAHRRLSIVDLSVAGQQPMCNETGTVWITFNGEIYNHAALRKELEALGHTYRSHSDTETIVHAYEEWGLGAVDRIDGMFAFALWDESKKLFWLVRDRMGKKPVYFAKFGEQLVFASEIKAILEHPWASRQMHEEAVWHYLTFAVSPAPLTLFKGIFKLPPGTFLTVTRDGRWTFREYWRPWFETDRAAESEEVYADRILESLQQAVDRRLMSDVPFGVFLSGGVDSSANVALMSQAMKRPVDTFSVGFADQSQAPYNEIQYARQVASLFKTNHHEILISDSHFFDFAEQLPYFQDEPLSDPVCFPLYYVSKLARDNGTIVIQVGEGSDELFAGYDIYRNYLKRQGTYWSTFQLLPQTVRRIIAAIASPFLHSRDGVHLRRAAQGEPAFLSAALAFYDDEKPSLHRWGRRYVSWKLSASAYSGRNPSMAMLQQYFPNATVDALPSLSGEEADTLKRMIFWECHQRLGELLLMRLDKMMMAHGVEGRAPFLDTKVVELAMKIPSSMKIQNGVGKAILKKAVEPLLPLDLIYRKKIGFCGGSGNMLTPPILDFAEKAILGVLTLHGWNRVGLQELIQAHREKRAENSFQIWNLMNLALWMKRWL